MAMNVTRKKQKLFIYSQAVVNNPYTNYDMFLSNLF